MTPSPEGWPTKAKEAPSPHEVRLAPLDTNPVFQSLDLLRLEFFFNWDTCYARLRSHYKAWSYKKKKHKKVIKAYTKFV